MGYTPRIGAAGTSPLVTRRTSLGRGRESGGMSSRRTVGGEVPSTPGSSPVKMKSESLREEPLREEWLPGFDTGGFGEELDFGGGGEEMRVDEEGAAEVLEPDVVEDMQEEGHGQPEGAVNVGLGIGGIGPDTQAAFEEQDIEDYSIPNMEITPSPEKIEPKPPVAKVSSFLDNLDEWVNQKSARYGLDQDLVHYILERTSCRPKLSVQVMRILRNSDHNTGFSIPKSKLIIGLPEMRGVWTEEDDEQLKATNARIIEKLDEKHGYGESTLRKEFLQMWNRSAMNIKRARWAG